MSQPPPIVLSFAANDPSGGAGIQADLLTIASMGCHPLSVITAVTVQDTTGVDDILPLDSEWITNQARTLLEDMPVHAFKLGLLGSVEIIAAIAEIVSDYPNIPLIMDPVLASGRGDELATEDMIDAMRNLLLPQVTLLTPNSLEARRLALYDEDDDDQDQDHDQDNLSLDECAFRLLDMGCEYVLITGTHENTSLVTNALFTADGHVRSDDWKRLPRSYHGSGCTLASAIAASMANGLSVNESVYAAQEYTWHTLDASFRPGMGQNIPNRLFWAKDTHKPNKSRPA
ncbi:bifunctional hydroxymethylpyrimidine kinase/phosphomethylpyrimidine kinase [Nitrosomonas aestuarii]|uniref:bifunctional hydroxymethylpyrimidine kinase/phosphomethylpyrimidine kinase n=1 Tax=Nitrosomonas aestuarii TaxID=52441 RepID=UPI000D3196EE|nr:hydroxymethylpyrimidine/phosphomethylpyrimidine kinase [Nitrosomonas aestuarii]PTN11699.1 hydroxymethylpyrimidine/phosphomethylpyrimidine kinase [Nitrosomonas aestuarii]